MEILVAKKWTYKIKHKCKFNGLKLTMHQQY